MKVLVMNGSPKKERSNTLKVTEAFLEGLNWDKKNTVEIIHAMDLDIKFCKSCYSCWSHTPGKCVIEDDMTWVIEKYLAADVVIWSTPVHTYSVSAPCKMIIDRLLPLLLPIVEKKENTDGMLHPSRFTMADKRYILISTCGYYRYDNNVESLKKLFEIMYADALTTIICTEGELFSFKQLSYRAKKYLKEVKLAGVEYAEKSRLSGETIEKIHVRHDNPHQVLRFISSETHKLKR
ncbi:MAG: flavodoxin family protein [Hungatella sp.]|jgi:multimeric flavodoxin WrbA|nr:flavodoxin family protein [Hungatella sp.]